MPESTVPPAPKERIIAIDALRGFDMFWITGGQGIVLGLAALLCGGHAPEWVRYQLEHPAWTGFTAWDMIMPTFLFLAGASMPFSIAVEKERGVPLSKIFLRIGRRVVLLWILGMIAQGNLLSSLSSMDFSRLRLYSNTLQSIASGYVLASIGVLFLSFRQQVALCAGLLLLFWGLMMFVPFGGNPAGTLEPRLNLALHVDEVLLGRFRDGTSYTWILSSLAFGGTVLLGVFAGGVLKSSRTHAEKLRTLVLMAVGLLVGGQIWGLHFPIIKHIWTSSMVLWAGGWSVAALAFSFWVLDMRGWRRGSKVFIVVGANAILAYVLGEKWVSLVEYIFEKFAKGENQVLEGVASLIAFATMYLALNVLYRKKIFVRV